MYHDIDDVGDDGCTVSIGSFRRQLELIKENGYTPISLQQLLDYVETGADLPESPVVITFDDGYYSNYQYALPVLEEYQYPAAIFVIGTSFGHMQYYKDTEYTLTPHFGASEAAEMLDSGLITLQSHTYDMHQWAPYETGDTVRENMLKLDSDSESSYISAVTEDLAAERALLKDAGVGSIFAAAYPSGLHETLTEATLAENGIKITFTVDNTRENVVVKGLSQSLYGLGRLNMNETLSDESLLNYLAGK
jgi:peptidoglycan/xylan/chitin deacetylase (PgdA/CDA1 family)